MVKYLKNKKLSALLQLLLLLLSLFLINYLASNFYSRIDLTKEKRFTLSSATIDLINNLDDRVYIEVYLEGSFPSGFRRLRNATEDMLAEFRSRSGNRIDYSFMDISSIEDREERRAFQDQLHEKGILPTTLSVQDGDGFSQKVIFPGAMVFFKGRELSVNLLESGIGSGTFQALNQSEELLEYKFASAINQLDRDVKPRVVFLEGHGELLPEKVLDISRELQRKQYEVFRMNIHEQVTIGLHNDVLIIAKPRERFSEQNKFKIDQFVMGGGSVIWLIDQMDAEMDSLRGQTMFFSNMMDLNLDDMLFKYGVRINPDLVQDLQCNPIPLVIGSMGGQPQTELFPWYYYPVAISPSDHPINRNIDPVSFKFASTIDTIRTINQDIDKTILLTSSQYSRALMAPVRLHFSMLQEDPNPEHFRQPQRKLAVLLEGTFESVFKNRLAPETISMIDSIPEVIYREESLPTKMLVISDGDFIRNETTSRGEIYPLGFYRYTEQTFANRDFLLNAIDYMIDDSGLIETRNREIRLRLLDRTKVNEEKFKWRVINMTVPLIFVLIFGIIYNFIRRKRFTS
ncbi:MAG: gliding motility-associated ABC transporter substrate-binding protein GldG [Chitinophagaceae bacterium]|nr:MAG: gliding motility-associated ABC transporter substrate-binding protein GldG [Chitinophagaceae bacterium]